MNTSVSKSQFKPKALEYLRLIEQLKQPLVITHAGKPVVRILPYVSDQKQASKSLKGTVISYIDPLKPVAQTDWEALS